MSEKEPAEGAEGAENGSGKAGKKKLIIIVVAVLLVLGVAGGAAAMLMKSSGSGDQEEAELPPLYRTADLGVFIVNLSEQNQFLKIKLMAEYDQRVLDRAAAASEHGGSGHGGGGAGGGAVEDPHALPPAMANREPILRDAVIRVLSSKRAEDVLSNEGKERLKEELIEAINEAIGLEENPVVSVYFGEFLVQ